MHVLKHALGHLTLFPLCGLGPSSLPDLGPTMTELWGHQEIISSRVVALIVKGSTSDTYIFVVPGSEP